VQCGWLIEIFHQVCKQNAGLEAAQVRNPEAVNRHFRLSCVAQSILQRAHCSGKQSEKFRFAEQQPTLGQRLYTLQREALQQLIQTVQDWLGQGQSAEQVLHKLIPA
jgi:hypothetical protein